MTFDNNGKIKEFWDFAAKDPNIRTQLASVKNHDQFINRFIGLAKEKKNLMISREEMLA